MHNRLTRVVALGAFALLLAGASEFQARPRGRGGQGSTPADFVAACSADENVTDEPGFEDGKVTPKAFCECVAGKLDENKASQKDVDMLTKMHKDEISDADAEGYPTLDDLMNANEGYEDACRTSLGLPAADDEEEPPMEEDTVPDDGAPPDERAPRRLNRLSAPISALAVGKRSLRFPREALHLPAGLCGHDYLAARPTHGLVSR